MTSVSFRVGLLRAALRRALDRRRRILRCEGCGVVIMRRGRHVRKWLYDSDDVSLCVPCWVEL